MAAASNFTDLNSTVDKSHGGKRLDQVVAELFSISDEELARLLMRVVYILIVNAAELQDAPSRQVISYVW